MKVYIVTRTDYDSNASQIQGVYDTPQKALDVCNDSNPRALHYAYDFEEYEVE